jgi:hypothetical protein
LTIGFLFVENHAIQEWITHSKALFKREKTATNIMQFVFMNRKFYLINDTFESENEPDTVNTMSCTICFRVGPIRMYTCISFFVCRYFCLFEKEQMRCIIYHNTSTHIYVMQVIIGYLQSGNKSGENPWWLYINIFNLIAR